MRKQRMVSIFKGNGRPMTAKKVERNKPCACGSGKKAKACCGNETKYFLHEKK